MKKKKSEWKRACLFLRLHCHMCLLMLEVFLLFAFVLFTQRCFLFLHPLTWRRQWQPTPVLLPGKSHGWRSLVGCSPWGREESDTTWATSLSLFTFILFIGGGNGNPLQCSCLENPRDNGAWWAAVYGVAQSWTRLKQLSSSSNPLTNSVSRWTVASVLGGSISLSRLGLRAGFLTFVLHGNWK